MKPKKPKDEESPTKLAKEYYRNRYDSKETKSVVPIGPKFVITNPRVTQVKAGLNIILLSIVMFAIFYSFCTNISFAQVTDIDGNVYKTVTIGNQEWMAENLNVSHYRNGDVIPQVQDKDEWINYPTGAWCYYENKTSNEKTYGKLYNWYAINDQRGLAPKGWHVPSDTEWTQLTDYLGGNELAGGKLKATTLWKSPNTGATNNSGFTSLPGGFLYFNGDYGFIGMSGYFWSTSANLSYVSDYGYHAWARVLFNDYSGVYRGDYAKKSGLSVRCVKD